jgi:hypothetical protein
MSQSNNASNALFSTPVVLDLPWQGKHLPDQSYGESEQVFDIYYPASEQARLPAVILVTGYSDTGYVKVTGMRLKDTAQSRSWARLLAASGIAAITYTSLDPVQDVMKLYRLIASRSAELRLDMTRLGILSLSGNVPNALHFLGEVGTLRCAALCYGFMRDGADDPGVSAASTQFRFAMPADSKPVPAESALLLVRAGQDQFAALNRSIDREVADALADNRDLELINYAAGVHAFDILDDSPRSRQIVRRILGFFSERLTTAA